MVIVKARAEEMAHCIKTNKVQNKLFRKSNKVCSEPFSRLCGKLQGNVPLCAQRRRCKMSGQGGKGGGAVQAPNLNSGGKVFYT